MQWHVPGVIKQIGTFEADDVEYILKGNFKNYVKGPRFHRNFLELLGDGIFNVDGEKWKKQR